MIDKQEVINLLKEHLKVEIKRQFTYPSYDNYYIELYFDNELISKSISSIPV